MADAPALLYLETDDEITAVVRRVRAATEERVVLVAPGRSRATSSAVALRLLARMGEAEGRSVAVVGDALTRSLAAEAGLDAYATVEDARRAVPVEAPSGAPRAAAIHVVRGGIDDDMAPVPIPPPPRSAGPSDETRPIPVVARRSRPTPRRGRAPARRRVVPIAGVLAVLGAFIVVAGALGVLVLPAATIAITPRSEAIVPVPYRLTMTEADRLSGEVSAEATVEPTGTYEVLEPATGEVVFFNWTFFPYTVPAGTLVAAGEQAFATQTDVAVARGRLTGQGTIAAGEGKVAVVARAPGPAANVDAMLIDEILDDETDARLRGFPENTKARVLNPEATTGGVDESGPAIIQEDVDTATARLADDLAAQVAGALGPSEGSVFADVEPPPTPQITGLDDLVGTRDPDQVQITGTLGYDRRLVDPAAVEAAATERLATDDIAIPPGYVLIPGSVEVTIGTAVIEDDALVVEATVTARSTAELDGPGVMELVTGLTADEAEAALEPLGEATVELWPGWVGTVPEADWRVTVRIAGPGEGGPLPSAGPSGGSAPP